MTPSGSSRKIPPRCRNERSNLGRLRRRFPDDQVEVGGDIKTYGGCNVAIALGEIFAGLGCSKVSKPWSAGEMGWEFDFNYGPRGRFWCRVQSFHPVFWLLLEDRALSDGEAHIELWRKFGNALERDPRFHKILWRSSKQGPPDWDEVEAASESPEGTFDKKYPPSQVKAKAVRPSIWPYIIGIWLTLSGVLTPLIQWDGADLLHRVEYSITGIFLFTVGAFFLFLAINQGRETPWPSRQKRAR